MSRADKSLKRNYSNGEELLPSCPASVASQNIWSATVLQDAAADIVVKWQSWASQEDPSLNLASTLNLPGGHQQEKHLPVPQGYGEALN